MLEEGNLLPEEGLVPADDIGINEHQLVSSIPSLPMPRVEVGDTSIFHANEDRPPLVVNNVPVKVGTVDPPAGNVLPVSVPDIPAPPNNQQPTVALPVPKIGESPVELTTPSQPRFDAPAPPAGVEYPATNIAVPSGSNSEAGPSAPPLKPYSVSAPELKPIEFDGVAPAPPPLPSFDVGIMPDIPERPASEVLSVPSVGKVDEGLAPEMAGGVSLETPTVSTPVLPSGTLDAPAAVDSSQPDTLINTKTVEADVPVPPAPVSFSRQTTSPFHGNVVVPGSDRLPVPNLLEMPAAPPPAPVGFTGQAEIVSSPHSTPNNAPLSNRSVTAVAMPATEGGIFEYASPQPRLAPLPADGAEMSEGASYETGSTEVQSGRPLAAPAPAVVVPAIGGDSLSVDTPAQMRTLPSLPAIKAYAAGEIDIAQATTAGELPALPARSSSTQEMLSPPAPVVGDGSAQISQQRIAPPPVPDVEALDREYNPKLSLGWYEEAEGSNGLGF